MASAADVDAPSTRSKVTQAAARLLREGGVHAVTTRAVASAAGVPTPTIFRIFGDKDGLMDAVAEQVMATYVAAKSELASHEDGDPVDDLREAVYSRVVGLSMLVPSITVHNVWLLPLWAWRSYADLYDRQQAELKKQEGQHG